MRRLLEADAAALEVARRLLDVVDLKIENRVELLAGRAALPLGRRQHQADAAAVEEGEARRRLEQEPHPEHVPIERHRARQVAHRHRDLPDPRQADAAHCCRHRALPASWACVLSLATLTKY